MQYQVSQFRLQLRHPFGLSRDTVAQLPTVLLNLDGGLGEAAPVRYLGDTAGDLMRAVGRLCRGYNEHAESDGPEAARAWVQTTGEPSAARAAVDVAAWDRQARQQKTCLYKLFQKDSPTGLHTSITIALDSHEAMLQRVCEATERGAEHLKIKLGRDPEFDRHITTAIRKLAPDVRIRVDANAGWTFDVARDMCSHLADLGVELVEQPLAIGQTQADGPLPALCRASPVPIFLDEDIQGPDSLRDLGDLGIAGVNLKLMKCGGLTPALELIKLARARGLGILLGCMIESRVGLAAAAALAPQVDLLDLDAHLLTTNDPFATTVDKACSYTEIAPLCQPVDGDLGATKIPGWLS